VATFLARVLKADLVELNRLVEAEKLSPVIDQVYEGLAAVRDAMRH